MTSTAEPSGTKRNQAEPSGTKRNQAEPSGTKRNQAEPSGTHYSLGYKPALDGLRGVAILLVVAVHAFLPDVRAAGAGASFVGVNLFFVLSGFLITSILVSEWRLTGRISLKRFYIRRILRLFPALMVLVATVVIVSWLLRDEGIAARNTTDSLLTLLYVANWTRAIGWDRPVVFGHTWSLSIEEQFYLLWPLALALTLKRAVTVPSLLRLSVLTIFVVAVYRLLLVTAGAPSERVFNGTDTRADALLTGCLLGVAYGFGTLPMGPNWRRVYGVTGWLAAGVLTLLCCRMDFHRPFAQAWLYPVATLAGAGLLLSVVAGGVSGLKATLETSPLVYVGRISYGLYLWHVPVFQLWITPGAPLRNLFTALLVAAGATLGSYYIIERPALRLKCRFSSEIV